MNSYQNMLLNDGNIAESDYLACSGINENHDEYFGAVAPPIIQTSLFVQKNYQQYCDDMRHEAQRYIYSRGLNPTVSMVETKLALLEGGEEARCFASGMGAISAVMVGLLNSGDHILLVNQIYGPAIELVKNLAKKYHIEYDIISNGDINIIEQKIKLNTRMIYAESPGTMTMQIVDLQAIAQLATRYGIITAIDNTWPTPLFQKPLSLGFDIVIHSCTKYLAGHSDVLAGVVITRRELMSIIRDFSHQLLGAVLSPFSAWLLLRGIRTLPIRMATHQHNAINVIEWLATRDEVENIRHPLCATDKEKEIIRRQMCGFSGLFSFELKGAGFEEVKCFIDACRIFKPGCSWGGYESLIISPNRGYNQSALDDAEIPRGLIRLSLGQENTALLIADLERAFDSLRTKP
ncbi:TPA: PLP-dependent transferase [Escherichia coli]|nr:PLP-dependent transferase [Escherichia coli]HAP0489598.1 PLP-dependent transferase [Escherichia coli]